MQWRGPRIDSTKRRADTSQPIANASTRCDGLGASESDMSCAGIGELLFACRNRACVFPARERANFYSFPCCWCWVGEWVGRAVCVCVCVYMCACVFVCCVCGCSVRGRSLGCCREGQRRCPLYATRGGVRVSGASVFENKVCGVCGRSVSGVV